MNSMPVPEAREVRDDARDLEYEYESSAGLKVHERMTYYVTKEIPQRGAITTTCTGPLCGETSINHDGFLGILSQKWAKNT